MATSAETRVVNAAGLELSTIYALAAIVALAMCAWSFVVAGRRPGPASMPLPGSGAR